MKRLIVLMSAVAILLSFAGCTKTEQGTQGSAQTTKVNTKEGELTLDKIKADLIESKTELQGFRYNNPQSIGKFKDYELENIQETERQKENGQIAIYLKGGFKTEEFKSVEDFNVLMMYSDKGILISSQMTSEPVKIIPAKDLELNKEIILDLFDIHSSKENYFETNKVNFNISTKGVTMSGVENERIFLNRETIKSLEIIDTKNIDEYNKKATLKVVLTDNRSFTHEFKYYYGFSAKEQKVIYSWGVGSERIIEFDK